MGAITKTLGIGAGVLVIGIAGLQALGSSIQAEFEADGAQRLAEDAGEVTKVRVTSKSQLSSPPAKATDLDEADHAIGAAINLKGYLCARPIEVREAASNLYGVRCVTNRDGTGISDYLVNPRSGEVTPI
jgi:hypothetical protein